MVRWLPPIPRSRSLRARLRSLEQPSRWTRLRPLLFPLLWLIKPPKRGAKSEAAAHAAMD